MKIENTALMCKALGDGCRLEVMRMVSKGEICACKILEKFPITQPTLSYHMKILHECGLVKMRKDGKWTYYSMNAKVAREFHAAIGAMLKTDRGGRR